MNAVQHQLSFFREDKWDYLLCPTIEKDFISSFEIWEVPIKALGRKIGTGLVFLPFIFIFVQCEESATYVLGTVNILR